MYHGALSLSKLLVRCGQCSIALVSIAQETNSNYLLRNVDPTGTTCTIAEFTVATNFTHSRIAASNIELNFVVLGICLVCLHYLFWLRISENVFRRRLPWLICLRRGWNSSFSIKLMWFDIFSDLGLIQYLLLVFPQRKLNIFIWKLLWFLGNFFLAHLNSLIISWFLVCIWSCNSQRIIFNVQICQYKWMYPHRLCCLIFCHQFSVTGDSIDYTSFQSLHFLLEWFKSLISDIQT